MNLSKLFAVSLFALAISFFAAPGHADPLSWKGDLSFQAPTFTRAEHVSENTPQALWNLRLCGLAPHLTVFSVGSYSLRDSLPWDVESKANIGINYDLSKSLSVYSFWESRYQVGQSRVVAGVTLHLGGKI